MESTIEWLKLNYPASYDAKFYHIAACVLCHAQTISAPILDVLQSIKTWPSHLPSVAQSRTLLEERTLSEGQSLTVIGRKLNSEDMGTLDPKQELNSNVSCSRTSYP